jgi:ribosomal-protein-alanine N-acetyltransferase
MMPAAPSRPTSIRLARIGDIPALIALENASFEGDRLSPRSFRHMLTQANAATLVEAEGGETRGYSLLLFRQGSRLARLYSFAVHERHRGKGIAKALLARSERAARARGCDRLRLEVRADNAGALRLYDEAGYRIIGRRAAYYDDKMAAVRMEKALAPSPARSGKFARDNRRVG